MSKPLARILVVDDEPVICELMSEYLRRWGYEPEAATSAGEALTILELRGCHLALIDLMMPGMTGEELAPLIKRRSPSTPVVMISAFPPDQVPGVDQIFAKPINAAKLRQIVDKYLEDELPFGTMSKQGG